MSNTKYYVVWRGREPGIYNTWEECQQQVVGFPAATYKSFKTEAEAQQAFTDGAELHVAQRAISVPTGTAQAPSDEAKGQRVDVNTQNIKHHVRAR